MPSSSSSSFFRSPYTLAFVVLNAMLIYWYLGYHSHRHRHTAPRAHRNESQPAVRTSTLKYRDYTVDELLPFNGATEPHILLAVDLRVYDVTSAPQYYGTDGSYAGLAGRDASRYLVAHTVPKADRPLESFDDLIDLTPREREILNGWVEFFEAKYPRVGSLVPVHAWAGSDHEEEPDAVRGAFIDSHSVNLVDGQ